MRGADGGLVIVTCGPARVRLDAVRCLTNLGTGEIGSVLAGELSGRGWRVVCYRGAGSTAPAPAGPGVEVVAFEEASDLEGLLGERAGKGEAVAAVFHAAALNDYVLGGVEFGGVEVKGRAKWRSDGEEVRLRLVRAPKVLPRLREWFPDAWIIGWKLEMDGEREEAVAAAVRQVSDCGTDGCVVNGRAFGTGFGLVRNGALVFEAGDKVMLARQLAEDLEGAGCGR